MLSECSDVLRQCVANKNLNTSLLEAILFRQRGDGGVTEGWRRGDGGGDGGVTEVLIGRGEGAWRRGGGAVISSEGHKIQSSFSLVIISYMTGLEKPPLVEGTRSLTFIILLHSTPLHSTPFHSTSCSYYFFSLRWGRYWHLMTWYTRSPKHHLIETKQ